MYKQLHFRNLIFHQIFSFLPFFVIIKRGKTRPPEAANSLFCNASSRRKLPTLDASNTWCLIIATSRTVFLISVVGHYEKPRITFMYRRWNCFLSDIIIGTEEFNERIDRAWTRFSSSLFYRKPLINADNNKSVLIGRSRSNILEAK